MTQNVDDFLQGRRRSIHTWSSIVVDEEKANRDAKEPDQSWALGIAGDVETVLEVVWCNETTKAFIQEVKDWHNAGRHVIGVRVFWDKDRHRRC